MTQAAARYRAKKRYRHRVHLNGGRPLTTDAAPVRDHVAALRAAGFSVAAIAELASVTTKTLDRLIYGNPRANEAPTQRLRHATARAILNVRPGQLPTTGMLPADGSRRRLQALAVALGWTPVALARETGLTDPTVWRIQNGHQKYVEAATAYAISRAYDRLWKTDPVTAGAVTPRGAAAVKRRAAGLRWALPMQWDDDEIDNPHAAPYLDHEGQVWLRHATTGRRLIYEHGLTIAQAAQQLGISAGHLNNCLTKMRAQSKEPAA